MLERNRTACFTGHRNISEIYKEKIAYLLDELIEKLYHNGVIFFGAGGAYGFDMLAEQAVLRAKKRHNDIKLILVLPCKEQDKYWTAKNQTLYAEILHQADKIVYTSEKYNQGCMNKRNRHLVNYSGYCIAFLNQSNSGTAYTVNYARKMNLKVINISDFIK